jgi:uncharacterized protein YacL (UPF0231 family)
MDYEFLRDITGVVKVRMSMGHEAGWTLVQRRGERESRPVWTKWNRRRVR